MFLHDSNITDMSDILLSLKLIDFIMCFSSQFFKYKRWDVVIPTFFMWNYYFMDSKAGNFSLMQAKDL